MANSYKEIFQAPGSASFAIAGLISRSYIGMVGIGTMTMLGLTSNNFRLAGMVSAVYVISMACMAPQSSRLADTYGQGKVLPIASSIGALGVFALLGAVALDLPHWIYFICAFFMGFVPSMPAMTRARWTKIYHGKPQLRTAFAFESVLDELAFVVGPPVSIFLCTNLFPEAGPLLGAILLLIGTAALVAQKSSEPIPAPVEQQRGPAILSIPAIWILMLALACMGIIAGTVDITAVAYASETNPNYAALVVAIYASSSCIMGLIFGLFKLKSLLRKQLLFTALGTALASLGMLGVYATNSLGMLGITVLLLGLFFAPTMIISMSLAEAVSPSSKVTEGLAWMVTGLNIGVAAGGALAGSLVDSNPGHSASGFLLAVVAGTLMFVVVAVGYHWLLPYKSSHSSSNNSAEQDSATA